MPSGLTALALAILGQVAFPEPLFLSMFPVSTSAQTREGTVEIVTRAEGRSFGELTRRRSARYLGEGHFVARVGAYPGSRDGAKRSYVRCSFVVDCDEPDVRAAAEAARRELGERPDMEQLTAWVGRFITRKTYGREFDTASVVARRREGDCTEHAVLLAALARVQKIPARVVTGLALIELRGKTAAVGHAWVEWHKGRKWLPADAALSRAELGKVLPGAEPRVTYLPVRVLEREDAGYASALMDGADVSQITGVVVRPPGASGP